MPGNPGQGAAPRGNFGGRFARVDRRERGSVPVVEIGAKPAARARDRLLDRIQHVFAVARLAAGDHAQAQGARPVDQTDQQTVLIAVHGAVHHPGAVGAVLQNRPDADISLLVDHGDVLAVRDRRGGMACARLGVPGGLHDHRDRQIHHQSGVGEDDAVAALHGRQCGRAAVAHRDPLGVDTGQAIGVPSLFDVDIGHDGDIKLRDRTRLAHDGGGVMAGADHAGLDGLPAQQGSERMDHGAQYTATGRAAQPGRCWRCSRWLPHAEPASTAGRWRRAA